MKIETTKDCIIVKDAGHFNLEATLNSGQTFRYQQKNDTWIVQSGNEVAKIKQIDAKNYKIYTKNPKYFVNYFDFETDYDIIIKKLERFDFLKDALKFSKGIRILKQEPFETLICFMISANNHIKRIKKSVGFICEKFGKPLEDGLFAFPTPKELGKITEDDLISSGVGYRAPYMFRSIQTLKNGYNFERLTKMSADEASAELQKFEGVGPKVADCVLLFGLGHKKVFPVDTWIAKVYNELFGKENDRVKMRKRLIGTFGELSGIAQQYLFYYKREKEKLGE